MKQWNIYRSASSRSGMTFRYLGQVEAKSEKAVLAAIKKLKEAEGVQLIIRDAKLDPWRRMSA